MKKIITILGALALSMTACSGGDGGGAGTTQAGEACETNADCAAGLECETEIEHGVETSFCKEHGGND